MEGAFEDFSPSIFYKTNTDTYLTAVRKYVYKYLKFGIDRCDQKETV